MFSGHGQSPAAAAVVMNIYNPARVVLISPSAISNSLCNTTLLATSGGRDIFRRIAHDLRIIRVYLVDHFLPRTSSLCLLNEIQLTLVLTFAIVIIGIMKVKCKSLSDFIQDAHRLQGNQVYIIPDFTLNLTFITVDKLSH